jgi:hypothetical protein
MRPQCDPNATLKPPQGQLTGKVKLSLHGNLPEELVNLLGLTALDLL